MGCAISGIERTLLIEQFGADGLRVDAVASMLLSRLLARCRRAIPNQHGGRENLRAIALLRDVDQMIRRETPGCHHCGRIHPRSPASRAPGRRGGSAAFPLKRNMNDTAG